MLLNEKILSYLKQNNISYAINDYQTGQPDGEEDQILYWNVLLGEQPTLEQLETAWEIKLSADAAVEYKTKRAAEYPSIVDQLDLLYHNGFDGWKAVIEAIKNKYPKP